MVVSSTRLVTVTSSAPSSFIVPANTSAPGFLTSGIDSPVMAAWLTADSPRSTTPSIAIFCPGLTISTSPMRTSSVSISINSPSRWIKAREGAKSIRLRIDWRALFIENDSSASLIANKNTTTAPSRHSPIMAAPMTAMVINVFISNSRRLRFVKPVRNI